MIFAGKIVAFFASKMGLYVLIAGGVLALVIGLRQQGYNAAERKCVAAAEQRKIEIQKRDVKIGELLAAQDQRNQTEQDKERKKDDEWQRKLEAELAKRPAAARCLLNESDRLKLR